MHHDDEIDFDCQRPFIPTCYTEDDESDARQESESSFMNASLTKACLVTMVILGAITWIVWR